MVAAFQTEWDFGGTANTPGTVETVLTNLRFNNEDTNDQDAASPVTIPTGADVFSFWKQIYLACRTTAPDNLINNVKIWTDASGLAWTGCTVNVQDDVLAHSTAGDAGYDPGQALVMTTHDTVTSVTDLFTYVTATPRAVTISETTSQIDAIGEFTDYVCLSLTVSSSAVQGTQATETITWRYDES